MVLQNKFKARASRRYNAARGGASDGRGRGRGGGQGGGGRSYNHEAFPSLPGQREAEDEEGEEGGEDIWSGEGERDASVEKKYARRKLQSNAWRYQEEEKPGKEGTGEEPEEEEPEVDLSGLFERVAKLDSNRTTQALSSQQAADSSLEAKEQDLDHTLLYLLDRQRGRERGKAVADGSDEYTAKTRTKGSSSLTPSELKMLEMEGKRLLEENGREKKHHSRAQVLKGGGRQNTAAKVISINIGDNNEGSRHREEERKQKQKENHQQEHSLRRKVQAPRQISMAALYDDEEEDNDDDLNNTNKEVGKGEDDDFISKLSPPSHRITSSNNIESVKRNNPATQTRTTQAAAPLKEQQDFLDSII